MIKNLLDKLKKGSSDDTSFDSVSDIQKPSRPGAPAQSAPAPIQRPVTIAPAAPVAAPSAMLRAQAQAQMAQEPQGSMIPKPAHQAFRREAPPKPITFDYSELIKDDKNLDNGVIIELGAGISLNVPIKRKMELDEFLKIADKVRNLEKLEIITSEMKG